MIKKENKIEYEYIKGKKNNKINLLFVHGSGCNKSFLKPLAVLFEDYNCYLIDLPGHGNSNNTGYNVENYVKAISYIASKLENVILIGHSLGGTLVAKTASLNLKSVIGLVILNSGAIYSKLDKEYLNKIHNGEVDMVYTLQALGHTDNLDVQEVLKTLEPNGNVIVDFLIDEAVNIEESLKYIKVPTLIIGGGDEILALPEYSEKMHETIRNSELHIIQGSKHMLPIAKKNEVKDLILKFIKNKIRVRHLINA